MLKLLASLLVLLASTCSVAINNITVTWDTNTTPTVAVTDDPTPTQDVIIPITGTPTPFVTNTPIPTMTNTPVVDTECGLESGSGIPFASVISPIGVNLRAEPRENGQWLQVLLPNEIVDVCDGSGDVRNDGYRWIKVRTRDDKVKGWAIYNAFFNT